VRAIIMAVLGTVLIASQVSAENASPALNLMPWPASVKPSTGSLPIEPSFALVLKGSDSRLQNVAQIFLTDLRRHTGMLATNFHVASEAQAGQLEIQSGAASKNPQQLGEDESYVLTVTSAKAELTAPTTLGVMRGLETFLQLIQLVHLRPSFR